MPGSGQIMNRSVLSKLIYAAVAITIASAAANPTSAIENPTKRADCASCGNGICRQPQVNQDPMDHQSTDHRSMPQDSMDHMNMGQDQPPTFIATIINHVGSGTDAEPAAIPHHAWMFNRDNWDFMVHGVLFVNDIQQSGPRGGDKFFGESWFMGMAQHDLGPGKFTARAMLSLDPALISERRYPELFQVGETAFGNPIVDGQHPHDFFMELAAFYDWKLSEHNLLSLYAAPIGDPALGPPAYPHRASASEDPIAVLGHHMQDSTHIADEVVTAGYTYRFARVEVSGFHGREPDENRWNIDAGAIDSWAARLTISPTQNWSGQFSLGTLKSPEALSPREDLRRMTASIEYARGIPKGNWASSVVWGRNRSLVTGEVENSYLFESTLHFLSKNAVWTRIENVDRTNLLLLGENPEPANFEERFLARIQAYTAGYDRDFRAIPHFSTAIGAQATFYGKPDSLNTIYGDHPVGVVMFVRIRPEGAMH
jgi:hypothetical protein